jgi:hypothetical protein
MTRPYNVKLLKLKPDVVYENPSKQKVKVNKEGDFFLKEANTWKKTDAINASYRPSLNENGDLSVRELYDLYQDGDAYNKARRFDRLMGSIIDKIDPLAPEETEEETEE